MGDKNNENILSIRGMSKSFGRNRVLDHINLDVKKGTVMGLMGGNYISGRKRGKLFRSEGCTGKWNSDGASGVEPVS